MARGKKKRKTGKTIKVRACASGRAFAKGARKGKCVPTKPVKGCYARTRKAAAEQLQVYDKRKASALHMQAKAKERKAAEAATRATTWGKNTEKEGSGFWGLSGHGRRRRRHRR